MSKEQLLEAISRGWDYDGDMRTKLAEQANVRPADEGDSDTWQEAEDQQLMLSWNWRVSISNSAPPLSKAEAMQIFAEADRNNDGFVSLEEFAALEAAEARGG